VSRERRSPQQGARLELELGKGPLAHGFAGDQRWTLGRIKTLIGKLFHVGYTVEGGVEADAKLRKLLDDGPRYQADADGAPVDSPLRQRLVVDADRKTLRRQPHSERERRDGEHLSVHANHSASFEE